MTPDAPTLLLVALPDGRLLALTPGELRAGLDRAAGIPELGPPPGGPPTPPAPTERLLDSAELGALLGVHATTVEAMAKDGRLPSIRVGAKALRFEPSAVLTKLRHADLRTAPSTLNQRKQAVPNRATTTQPRRNGARGEA